MEVLIRRTTMKKRLTARQLEEILAKALIAADQPIPELHLDVDVDLDADLRLSVVSAPASTPTPLLQPVSRSEKISIRVQSATLRAFKAHAKRVGVPYQRLMNRALRAAARELD